MKFRITLFTTVFGIFIPLNSANAVSDRYIYGFSWGSVSAICTAYSFNAISEKDAVTLLNAFIELGKEDIKDFKLKNEFNNLIKTDNDFKQMGCSKLIK
tara:strand:+ start:131 stop:427 length:297 start_codon:yes stop_codon:yes gene_type:complete